jgi:hypothetical protein
VLSTNPTANTFQVAVPIGSGTYNYYTFSYGQTGSSYNYSEWPTPGSPVSGSTAAMPISEAQFTSYLSGEVPNGAINGSINASPNVPGDVVTVYYAGSTAASTFQFNQDVPAAPTGVTATNTTENTSTSTTANSTSGVLVSWTAPANPDVYSYQVYASTYDSTTAKWSNYAAVIGGGYTQDTSGAYNVPNSTGIVTGSESANAVVTTPPATSFFDTSETAGAVVKYEVVATSDGNNGSVSGPASAASAAVTVPTPSYPALAATDVNTLAATESGAANVANATVAFTPVGGTATTATYASNVADFATVTDGQVTVLPYTVETAGIVLSGSVAPGDALAVWTVSGANYYVDLTQEAPGTGGTGQAYVGVSVTNTGGTSPTVSMAYNGTSDGNTTATDSDYIPVATGITGGVAWTIEPAKSFTVQVTTTGGGSIANGTYNLTATTPG